MNNASALASCSLRLPAGFRARDMLAFHARDPLGLAERVDGELLHKGLVWAGSPACLTIRFHARRAEVQLAVDGTPDPGVVDGLERMARRMLGLTQRIEAFERAHASHAQIGPLIARQRGLRVPVAATPFEALSWAITGQQISVAAAVSLRRRLIVATGMRHSSGLACHPDAFVIARLDEAALRAAGLSEAKARALLALSRGVADGALPLDAWSETLPVDDIRARLLGIRGIGAWTVEYALLRGYGWLDGSLHGDVAVRHGLRMLLGDEQDIPARQAERWLAEFSPWRALVAAHLWAFRSAMTARFAAAARRPMTEKRSEA